MTEGEMVGWHHRLDGCEFEQALGLGDGQGSLACCSPWGHKESDMTEPLNRTEMSQAVLGTRDVKDYKAQPLPPGSLCSNRGKNLSR